MRVPKATIRTQVSVPLRFADGYVTVLPGKGDTPVTWARSSLR